MCNDNLSPSLKAYRRGFNCVKRIGYPRHGPLSNRLDARVKPLDHGLFRCKPKKLVGLGYEKDNENTTPILDKLDIEEEPEYTPNLENQ